MVCTNIVVNNVISKMVLQNQNHIERLENDLIVLYVERNFTEQKPILKILPANIAL
jgi:hypothetical protein